MILLFINKDKLIITEKPLREARTTFGHNIEQIDSVKLIENIDTAIERCKKSYKFIEIIRDYKVKIKKIVSAEARAKMSEAAKNRKWDQSVKEKIAASRKGRGNHKQKHNWEAKALISDSMRGNTNAKGLKWCYDPVTLDEFRVECIPYNLAPRRPPASISAFIG